MKIGLSSYSLYQALKAQELTIIEAIDWVNAQGGEHIAIVPLTTYQKAVITDMINAGSTVAAVISFIGGGALIGYLIRKAFKHGGTKVILAA